MYSQIDAWLDRLHPLPKRFSLGRGADIEDAHWLIFIAINEVHPLHLADSIEWEGLTESSIKAKKYVNDAINALGSDQVEEIGDKNRVISKLGAPPKVAMNIYIITIKNCDEEKVVYIGKTASKFRFADGHAAALKLHSPKFDGTEKLIYRCSVTVSLDDWVLLEWIEPLCIAQNILDDVESRLIHEFKPELNTLKIKSDIAKHKAAIHIQNVIHECKQGSFLNDYIIDQVI